MSEVAEKIKDYPGANPIGTKEKMRKGPTIEEAVKEVVG